jgi:HK97 family phage major capsid protein
MSSTDIDVKTLNDQLAKHRTEAERISQTFKVDEKGRFTISTEQHQAYVTEVKAAQDVKAVIEAKTAMDGIGAYLDAPAGASEAARDAGFSGSRLSAEEGKSLGELFTESKSYRQAAERGFDDSVSISARIEGKTIYNFSAGTSTIQTLGNAEKLPIAELARRKNHIRDLFPKSTTKAPVLFGVREMGWVNNAAQVRQRTAADGTSPATGAGTDKWGRVAKSKLTLQSVLFPVAEIGHTLDAHKNILSDESRLQSFINNRMVEGVKYSEDYDLLHSVGDGERITGLFNTPGIQQYAGLDSDGYSVQVRRAVTKSLLAEYEPSGLVVSPTMWEAIEVEQDKMGQFRVAVSVAVGGRKVVWRLNVVETTAMDDTVFLLGAFGMGAQLHDREAVSVRVSSENASNFEDGIVTFRADERLALEVVRPESFVIGTWTTPVVS